MEQNNSNPAGVEAQHTSKGLVVTESRSCRVNQALQIHSFCPQQSSCYPRHGHAGDVKVGYLNQRLFEKKKSQSRDLDVVFSLLLMNKAHTL